MTKYIPPKPKTAEVLSSSSKEMAKFFAEVFMSELATGGIDRKSAYLTTIEFYRAHIFDAVGAVLKTTDADKIKLYAEGIIRGMAEAIKGPSEVVS